MDDARRLRTRRGGGNYRALFEQSPVPTALVSMRGQPRFVTASRGFLETFGLRRSALEGRALDDVLKARGDGGLAAALNRCLVTSETIRIDVEHQAHGSRRLIGLVAHLPHARGFANHVVLEAQGRGHAVHSFEQRLTSMSDTLGGE